jgi:hypothetical protein
MDQGRSVSGVLFHENAWLTKCRAYEMPVQNAWLMECSSVVVQMGGCNNNEMPH